VVSACPSGRTIVSVQSLACACSRALSSAQRPVESMKGQLAQVEPHGLAPLQQLRQAALQATGGPEVELPPQRDVRMAASVLDLQVEVEGGHARPGDGSPRPA
jgi:hypothetical protein